MNERNKKIMEVGMAKRNGEIDATWDELAKEFGITGEKMRMSVKNGLRSNKELRSRDEYIKDINEHPEKQANYKTWEMQKQGIEERKTDINKKEIVSLGRIRSLDDLVRECKIDLKIWKVDRWVCNKWEVGRKGTSENIVYNNGIKNGTSIDRGNVVVEPLFQIKAWLCKIVPDEQLFPVIQPIKLDVKFPKIKIGNDKKLKRCLVIPDSQNGYNRDVVTGKLEPFHDRKCWDLVLQLSKKYQPDKIVFLGDMIDLNEWSDHFIKKPEFYFTTQPAIMELTWWFSQMRMANKNAEIVYLEGNHELRLKRAIYTNMVASYNIRPVGAERPALSIPNLLSLDSMNISYIEDYPAAEYWINDNLCTRHGELARGGSGKTIDAILKECRSSEIIGHIHRQEMASKTAHSRNKIVTYTVCCPGTISRIDGVVPSKKGRENWQQGCSMVDYEDGNGYFSITPIPIYNGVCIYNGVYFKAEDRVKEISKDINLKDFTIKAFQC